MFFRLRLEVLFSSGSRTTWNYTGDYVFHFVIPPFATREDLERRVSSIPQMRRVTKVHVPLYKRLRRLRPATCCVSTLNIIDNEM